MRLCFGTIIVALSLNSAQCAPAQRLKDHSINTTDLKAGYEHVAARYASWAERKKKQHKSYLTYGGLGKLMESTRLATPAPIRKRGTVLPLYAVGGYPKMLGQTFNVEVGMGTPAQLFNLTADTGSTLTWAVQASCKETDCPGVAKKRTYDPSKSRTSKKLGSDHEAYGDGEMDLTLYNDTVHLGKISVNAATIGGADKTFEKDGELEHDGLFGLGKRLDVDTRAVLSALSKQDKRFSQTIALDLGANASLEIGGYDFRKYRKLVQIRVDDVFGWLLPRSIVTAQGAAQVDPVDLLVDSGSSVSMLPASRMDAIMDRPGLKVQKSTSEPITYAMPCDTKLNVHISLPDGTQIPVKDADILMQSNDANMPGCLSLLVGTTNPFLPAVLGTPMLKSIYTVLSRSATGDWIGLAPLAA
ncbi:Aspartic peptidase [Kalmanozyma brasiliensis GHG001]|uniref:Peptidase A1 domain-containing protein n=1 Tax=Kalmanozyma brasiliensis (strain GHG001) TaxID=1365824 RepID=V5EQ55_KALBG|nr:Aspartic peptidase [Kalmanozyma brasiliensis GHG001]EST07265.1 Aspartic peptidase [Kalmanozyma brasiliensis GHG001]